MQMGCLGAWFSGDSVRFMFVLDEADSNLSDSMILCLCYNMSML